MECKLIISINLIEEVNVLQKGEISFNSLKAKNIFFIIFPTLQTWETIATQVLQLKKN